MNFLFFGGEGGRREGGRREMEGAILGFVT
jgi:hypothetical protein